MRAGERRGNAELGRGDERGWRGGSGGVIGFGARPAMQLCWGRLDLARGGCCGAVAGLALVYLYPCGFVAVVCAWRCGSVGAVALARVRRCVSVAALPSRAFGGAFLLPRCPRARLASRSCHGVTLARGWHCGSGGAITFGVRLSSLFYCGDLPSFTPAVCRMATNRTACGILRSYSAGSRSPFARSRGVGAVICLGGFTSGLVVSLWRSRRGCRDAGNGERGTGLAARRLYVFAWAHWLCGVFRREYVGAARPKPAPKSLRLSGLSSRCGGVGVVRIRAAVTRAHGET